MSRPSSALDRPHSIAYHRTLMQPPEPARSEEPASRWRYLGLLVLPLLLLAPSLLPGRRFLPQLPAMYAPLASEDPERAARAAEEANLVCSDAVFPLLGDELAIREALFAGELPLWGGELGMGMPLAAGSMAAPWNPLRWPFLWLAPDVARGWHALLSLVLAGLGMLGFLERRVSARAALIGALGVQAGGFAFANLHYLPKLDAALWLPWCFWALEAALRGGSRRAASGLFAALACSALAGFPPIFFFVVLASAIFGLAQLRGVPTRHALRVVGFGLLGLMAGSIALLPMARVAMDSTRGEAASQEVLSGSLAPAALAGLLSGEVFGLATDLEPAGHSPVAWWLSRPGHAAETFGANRLEWSIYVGVPLLLLALAALGSRERRVLGPALALVLCLAFQFGVPGVRWLYLLPGFDLGSPARAGCLAWVLFPWLSALGFDAVVDGRRGARIAAFGAGAALLLSMLWLSTRAFDAAWCEQLEELLAERHGVTLAVVRDYFTPSDSQRAFGALRAASTAALGLCALSLLALWSLSERRLTSGSALITALVVAGGLLSAWSWVRPRSLESGEPLLPPSEALEAVRAAAGDGRVVRLDRSPSGIDEVLLLARPNLLPAYGIADLAPYVALPGAALVEELTALDPGGAFRSGWSGLSVSALASAPLLDRLNVTCLLSSEPLEESGLELTYERPGFCVHRRSAAVGRARLQLADGSTTRSGVRIVRESRNEHTWLVSASMASTLILSQAADPDWQVEVDDAPAALEPSDRWNLRVPLQPGTHTIRFAYSPTSFFFGAGLSGLALLLALLLSATGRTSSLRGATSGARAGEPPQGPA